MALDHFKRHLAFSLAGMVLGYLLLHPYVVLTYTLMHLHDNNFFHAHWGEIFSNALKSFGPTMLPLGIAFAIFGGVTGLLISIIFEKKRKWYLERLRLEKSRVALKTLKELMVTLAHYLLNSNMIIGGKVRFCRKRVTDEEVLKALAVIEFHGRKIDSVIRSLRKITEVKESDYTMDGTVVMIDIEKELEKFMSSNNQDKDS